MSSPIHIYAHVGRISEADTPVAITIGDQREGEDPLANARLIAAAPELLEACKAALGAFEHNHAINWDDLARAIDKAEGRDNG